MADAAMTPAQRLPRAYVGAAYLERVPVIVGLLGGGVLCLLRPDRWPGPWAWVVIGPLVVLRLAEPLYRMATVLWEASELDLRLTTGHVHRRTRTVPWSEVRALDVQVPWAYRPFGLARVVVGQTGDASAQLVLPAADAGTQQRIKHLAQQGTRPAVAAREPARGPEAVDGREGVDITEAGDAGPGRLLYRATLADLLLATLVYGQFAVAGGAVAMSAWDLLDTAGLGDDAGRVFGAAVGAAVVLLVVVVGFVVTVVRFAGFEVRTSAVGAVEIRFGSVARLERSVDRRAVAGVVLQQNLAEKLFGRVRLALLTTDSAVQLGANLVLPSLPPVVVARVLDDVLPDVPTSEVLARIAERRLRSAVQVALVTALPAVLVALALRAASAPRALVVLGALAVLVAVVAAGRLASSRLVVGPGASSVALWTSHVSDRVRVLRAEAVHVVSLTALLGLPLLVRAYYHAGMPRTLTAVRFRPSELESLQAGAGARGLAQARGRRASSRGEVLP
ncbi:PH domain-containing protein [Cellulomonas sp. JZ18]|uniref:PH domain-containing protein n=1 Tax=Cellulomonas sp. JZ18 TaxID=2654191 RepID=UPI0012D41E50|nr:PH domain-containing protein [Cellulomonas sp. JZ18]QGQ20020.1 PH domain-containing protein [Cellulomonas sp. JZ18]